MLLSYDAENKWFKVEKATTLEYNQLKLSLNRKVKGFQFMPSFKRGIWDGEIKHFKSDKIPLGLWKETVVAMNKVQSKMEVSNKKDFPLNRDVTLEKVQKFCETFFKDHKVMKDGKEVDFYPYDHQIETAYHILRNMYCTAEVATGGGKSLIISIIFFYLLQEDNDLKMLLIVPSIDLVTQFYDDIVDYNEGFNGENSRKLDLRVNEIMSSKPRKWRGEKEPNIFISTFQSLSKPDKTGEEFYTQFDCIACDEAHLAKSKSFIDIMGRTIKNSSYQFGVSGTFQDDGFADYITIQSLTGPKVAKIKAKELQDKGIISYVRISQILLNHDDPEFYDNLKGARKNGGSGSEIYRLEGEYIRNSEPRKDFIVKLLNNINKNTLVLYNIIEFGDKLKEYLEEHYHNDNLVIYMINGGVKKDKREEIKKELEKEDGKLRILLATYGTLSTGVSIKNIHNIIFAEGFKVEQRTIQSIGRSLRLHDTKDVASIYDLVDMFTEDSNNILKKHGVEREKMYNKHEYPYKITKRLLGI